MLRLNLTREPTWYDMPFGVRICCAPVGSTVMESARADLRRTLLPASGGDTAGDDGDAQPAMPSNFTLNLCKAIASRVIVDWDGVGDENGAAVALSSEWIDALMEDDTIFQSFWAQVVSPARELEAEGNVSSGAPNGTSEAPDTVKVAQEPAQSAQPS